MVEAAKSSPFGVRIAERAPLSVLVSRQLREAIVSGKVAIGTEMPSEKDLSRDLGVSRATVREALRILQAQGLISGGETVSTARPRVSSDQTLATAAQAIETVVRLGHVPLRDLVELRVVIEGAAVVAAAELRDENALGEARSALDAMARKGVDALAFRAADLRFHRALAAASGNAAYPLVMGVLREAISTHLGEALLRVRDLRRTTGALIKEHGAILTAIEHGHGKRAQTLVAAHIHDFYVGQGAP